MFERQILVTMLTWMWRQACSMLSSSTRRNPLWVVAQRSIVKATSQLSVRLLCGVSLALARIARFSLIRGDRLNPSHWTTSASTPLRRLSVRLVPVPWGVTEWADHGRIVDPAVKWNSQSGHCFGRKKSRTFQVLSSTYSQTHSHDILPHVTLNVCGSVRNNFSHRGHDDLEQVKFKDFQDPMTASSKFQDPVRFSRTFKNKCIFPCCKKVNCLCGLPTVALRLTCRHWRRPDGRQSHVTRRTTTPRRADSWLDPWPASPSARYARQRASMQRYARHLRPRTSTHATKARPALQRHRPAAADRRSRRCCRGTFSLPRAHHHVPLECPAHRNLHKQKAPNRRPYCTTICKTISLFGVEGERRQWRD